MTAAELIRGQLKTKIQSCVTVQQVYGHEELNPSGWPAVMLTPADMQGEFSSNTENSRVYGFNALILFPVGKDMPGLPSNTNRMEYAENVIFGVVDEIINAVDTDFELDGSPVLFTNAVGVTWGYTNTEAGETRSAQLSLRVYTELTI